MSCMNMGEDINVVAACPQAGPAIDWRVNGRPWVRTWGQGVHWVPALGRYAALQASVGEGAGGKGQGARAD